MGDMWVDTDHVRRTAPGLDDIADDIADAFDKLEQVLKDDDGCWGKDKYGDAFSKSYQKADADGVERSTSEVIKAIRRMREGLHIAAGNYDGTETTNTDTFSV